jgi:hypothetical protein
VAGIGDVEQMLRGQFAADLGEHGQPADAGVEDADGAVRP